MYVNSLLIGFLIGYIQVQGEIQGKTVKSLIQYLVHTGHNTCEALFLLIYQESVNTSNNVLQSS